jgi:hypothetical protein
VVACVMLQKRVSLHGRGLPTGKLLVLEMVRGYFLFGPLTRTDVIVAEDHPLAHCTIDCTTKKTAWSLVAQRRCALNKRSTRELIRRRLTNNLHDGDMCTCRSVPNLMSRGVLLPISPSHPRATGHKPQATGRHGLGLGLGRDSGIYRYG